MGERALKFLLIQLRQLGDILLTTPAIRAIKAMHPDSEISFLTHPMGKLILSGNKDLDEHLIYPTDGRIEQLKFLMMLRAKKFDVVFDFMGNPRSALLTKISGAPQRYSFASPRSWAYTGVVPRESGHDYIVQEKFRILSQADIHSDDVRLVLPWNHKDLQPWCSFLTANDALHSPKLRVLLSPTHRRENRRWPANSWVRLAEWLTKDWQANVIWLWGPGEEEEVSALHKQCPVPTFMAPKTSFRELAALMSQCELFVGNSNGPSHVAVAVNTPSVQLHGPTDAPSWSPMTTRHKVVAKPTMTEIFMEDVLGQLEQLKPILDREVSIRDLIQCSQDVWLHRPIL